MNKPIRVENLRDVDTNSYLPQVIGDAKQIKDLNLVQDWELENLWIYANRQYYNRWILEADSEGLVKYESLTGLRPEGTLEDRRKKVFYEWNKSVLYTDRSVRQLLDELVGVDGYFMEILHSEYIVDFEIILKKGAPEVGYVYRELRTIVPANMYVRFTVMALADLYLGTSFLDADVPFYWTGNHKCGTIYDYAVDTHIFDEWVRLRPTINRRDYRHRVVEAGKATSQMEIYATENRRYVDASIVLDNNQGMRRGAPFIMKGGSPYDEEV